VKTSSAKAKGRRLQQYVMERIAKLLDQPCGKDTLIASREMGQSGTDIRLIGPAADEFPFSVECKNCENWSVHSWVDQAIDNSTIKRPWLIFAKRNRGKVVVMMDDDTFFALMNIVKQVEMQTGIDWVKAWLKDD
jgi:hypothetical protein